MRKGLFAALFCAMMFLLLPAAAYALEGEGRKASLIKSRTPRI